MTLTSLIPILVLPAAVSAQTTFGSDIIQMFFHAGLVVKFVLIILIIFSIISWAIIFVKWRYFQKARHETAYFLDLFWDSPELAVIHSESKDLMFSPVAHLFKGGYAELKRSVKMRDSKAQTGNDPGINGISDSVERALKRTTIDQGSRMERALAFLATTGNTAPFIGLFGTVWGIMESFRDIDLKGSASLAVVAPGISEALIATAAGLAAAIPAVIAFNYFNSRVYELRAEMDTFTADFLSIVVRRSFIKRVEAEKK
jgi:biopolymer transport protein TolQ